MKASRAALNAGFDFFDAWFVFVARDKLFVGLVKPDNTFGGQLQDKLRFVTYFRHILFPLSIFRASTFKLKTGPGPKGP
jgi:hypothetical protein